MLIDHISKSISQMSNSELYERIKEVRRARRVNTPIPRGSKTKKSPSTNKLKSLASSLPQEALANLISELEADL